VRQWERTSRRFALEAVSNDSKLFERSVNLLLAHEDKSYPGAMIASLSIPWGDEQSDDATGGYHLVMDARSGEVRSPHCLPSVI
jgi:glucoamylase